MSQTTIDLSAPLDARRELACDAALEISEIIECLNGEHDRDGTIQPSLWRGMYLRIQALTSVAISALDDDVASVEQMADQIYGTTGWRPAA